MSILIALYTAFSRLFLILVNFFFFILKKFELNLIHKLNILAFIEHPNLIIYIFN